MSSIYQDLQKVASQLLGQFDQKSPGAASPDPITGNGIYYIAVVPGNGPVQNPGASTETPFKIDAVARGVSFKYIDNKSVVATDLQITMGADTRFTPNERGFALIDGVRVKVIQVIRKPAAGTVIAWTIIVRK